MSSEQVKVKCTGIDEEGKGIVKIKGREMHVSNLIDGETAAIEVKQKGNFISAEVIRIEEKSKYRAALDSTNLNQYAGCQLQHMSYEGQIQFKQGIIEKLMKPYHKVNKILGMDTPYYYRNKVLSTFAYDEKGRIISGIYEENTHHVIPVEQSIIEDRRTGEIFASIRDIMKSFKMKPFDEDTAQGFLRHVLIRTGYYSNEIMVVLIVASHMFPAKNNFVRELIKRHPGITTIVMNVNNRRTSVVLGETEKVLYGKGYIEDTLCGKVFQISPKSFYQINPIQTEVLYGKAIEMAKLKGNETVLDAYCGIGTISLIVSDSAKDVVGVELNKDAVKDAIKNAKRNNIKNTFFYNADAGDFMVNLAKEKQAIDVVFMDPPRSGSDEKFLSSLARLAPKKVIYISCNPVTQERDIRFLMKYGYKVEEIQPVDMFPQTYHVETVCLLVKN